MAERVDETEETADQLEITVPEKPKSRIFDIGVVELNPNTGATERFTMPFDGWVYKIGVSWPTGANNAIGVKVRVEAGPTLIPANPDVEYVADDDVHIPFYTIEEVDEGNAVRASIYNDSDNNKLDLQVRVTVTNFNPLLLATVVE